MTYHAICPECKNDINLGQDNLAIGDHFECATCGITLEARAIEESAEPKEIKETEIMELEK